MVVAALSAIIVILLWRLLRPMKTWYVVEARICEGDIASLVFVGDFTEIYAVGSGLRIASDLPNLAR